VRDHGPVIARGVVEVPPPDARTGEPAAHEV
jgi:hypothetical protein